MIERLKKLRATKGQFANHSELSRCLKSDNSLRQEIDALSHAFLNKKVSGCSNCYSDAYFELITLSIDKVMDKSIFELKRGALLYGDESIGIEKYTTQANITDELALYHLKTKPSCMKLFAKLPENWEEMVEAYELPTNEQKPEKKKRAARPKKEENPEPPTNEQKPETEQPE